MPLVGVVSRKVYASTAFDLTLPLTGSAETMTVSLTNVNDAAGNTSASVSITLSVLVGDTNGDSFVSAGDALQTRNRSSPREV